MMILLVFFCSCKERDMKTGWEKYENSPVPGGGDLGTVFDIFVLKDGQEYIMY